MHTLHSSERREGLLVTQQNKPFGSYVSVDKPNDKPTAAQAVARP